MAGYGNTGPLGIAATAGKIQMQVSFLCLLGGGFTPGPIGLGSSPGKPAPSPSTAKAKKSSIELFLVGSFPKPASWTYTREKQQIVTGKWFPHTLDFQAVAGKGSIEVTSCWDFLLKISQTSSSINRLNFFSHAKTGLIALEGVLAEDGSYVSLAKSGADGGWTQVHAGTGTIVDPYAGIWGDHGENSKATINVGGINLSLDQIRAKFSEEAVIWLYLCHGASDPKLIQQIANTFQVTVKGFTKELVYCAPNNFPTSRQHAVAVLTTVKHADSCRNGVTNFHQLDNHIDLRTKSPVKPTP
jgi:hypothetical protein